MKSSLLLHSYRYRQRVTLTIVLIAAAVVCVITSLDAGDCYRSGSVSAAMRIVIQRVKSASVTIVDTNEMISQIGPGLVALVGIHTDDTMDDVNYCCQRIIHCKLWNNAETNKPWKYSVKQKQYDCLLVSQFTLYGTVTKKSSYQPDYKLAMKSDHAKGLYEHFIRTMQTMYDEQKIYNGKFGTMMDVALINDGPMTIVIESRCEPTTTTTSTAITPDATATTTGNTTTGTTNDNTNSSNATDAILLSNKEA